MTPSINHLRVRILGGGIAGLGCALALTKRTGIHDIQIFERASSLTIPQRIGHGLILMANGVQALQTLQADHFLTHATPLTQAIFQDQHGRPLTTDPLNNTYCVSRLELVKALQAELPPAMIRFDEPCISLDINQQKTIRFVQFGSGDTLRNNQFDLLIDASGGRSPLCHALNPGLHRPLSRVKEIVTSTRWPSLAAKLGSRFIKTVLPERGLAFGLLAPNKERVIGFLQLDSTRYTPPGRAASESELRHFLQTVLHPAPEIVSTYLQHADLSTAHLWHPLDANIPAALSGRNAIAIGDAAHPLLPFTSQGTGSALEDAILLADTLRELDGNFAKLPEALTTFSNQRRRDLTRYVEGGRRILNDFINTSDSFVLPYIKESSTISTPHTKELLPC